MSAVLTHVHFQRPPVAMPKRPRRLPPGVVSIKAVPRLRVGVLAEVFDQVRPDDNAKRVRIEAFDPKNDGYHWECVSLDGPIECEDGSFARTIWMKPGELRRLWTGGAANRLVRERLSGGAA